MNVIEFWVTFIIMIFAYFVGMNVGRYQVKNNLNWFGNKTKDQ